MAIHELNSKEVREVSGGYWVGDSWVDDPLMQLTASGWQQVVDGQLVPYAMGVLSELQAAQTILNNTNVANLQGAEFYWGYGNPAMAVGPVTAWSGPEMCGGMDYRAG